jgi:ribokinase
MNAEQYRSEKLPSSAHPIGVGYATPSGSSASLTLTISSPPRALHSNSLLPQNQTPTMAPKAVISVIGSLNVDLVTRTTRVPVAGETLTSESFDIGYGGKGANQAVACARLSRTQQQASNGTASDVEVRMVGAVGDDEFHAGFLKSLQKDGVGIEGVEVLKGKKTGVAVITVETSTGENRIMFCPGANYEVKVGDLVDGDASVALFQLELPLEVVGFWG